jgi:hypothetical protein
MEKRTEVITGTRENDTTINNLFLEAIVDRLEDIEDKKVTEEHEREKSAGTLKSCPIEDVIKEFGLEDEILHHN